MDCTRRPLNTSIGPKIPVPDHECQRFFKSFLDHLLIYNQNWSTDHLADQLTLPQSELVKICQPQFGWKATETDHVESFNHLAIMLYLNFPHRTAWQAGVLPK